MLSPRLRLLASSAWCVLVLGVSTLAAQDFTALTPGDRIRLQRIGAPAITASLLRITPDELTYSPDPDQTTQQTISLRDLSRLEVSRGPASAGHGFLRGAGIGLLAGGTAGGFLALATYEPCRPPEVPFGGLACLGDLGQGVAVMGGAVAGGLLGGLIGGAIGASSPRERWERVRPPAHVSLSRTATAGTALTITVAR